MTPLEQVSLMRLHHYQDSSYKSNAMRKDIYCEMSFLLLCVSKLENGLSSFETDIEYQLWNTIFKTIFSSNINLHLDMKKEEFEAEYAKIENGRREAALKGQQYEISPRDRLVLDIESRQKKQELHLLLSESNPLTNKFQLELDKHYSGIYFTCTNAETCQKMIDEYGILVLCPNNIMDFKEVLTDNGIALHKGNSRDWTSILSKKFLPCNAMAIVDNYILSDTQKMKENLSEIIDALELKIQKLTIPFQITIFSLLADSKGRPMPIDCRWDIIKTIMEEKNINISILKCKNDIFHDRTLLTNNQFIGCGGGFDLFKNKKATKTTTVNIVCPYLNNMVKWAKNGYSNVYDDANTLFNDNNTPSYGGAITYSFPIFSVGEKVNRLFFQ